MLVVGVTSDILWVIRTEWLLVLFCKRTGVGTCSNAVWACSCLQWQCVASLSLSQRGLWLEADAVTVVDCCYCTTQIQMYLIFWLTMIGCTLATWPCRYPISEQIELAENLSNADLKLIESEEGHGTSMMPAWCLHGTSMECMSTKRISRRHLCGRSLENFVSQKRWHTHTIAAHLLTCTLCWCW